jgi:hypothetical protein
MRFLTPQTITARTVCALLIPSLKEGFLIYIAGAVVLVALLLAWYRPLLGDSFFRPVEKAGKRFALRKGWVVLGIAAATIIARLGLLWLVPVPIPMSHDEFAYLLAADTFAHGRLANPPHPMALFLDTIHVNQHPTYMSKYPPAQSAVLALGQKLGHPWIGVLLSMAAMCAAIAWMLQGWFPPVWALIGAVLVLLRFAVFNYWMNSYWGGAVAAIGGALVLGSLPRIFHHQRPRDSALLGLGASLLANSRPVEGLIFCLPVAAALGGWLLSRSRGWRVSLRKVVLPVSTVLLLNLAFMGYYNWRGTGNPLLFPYVANERAHFIRPVFVWQKARPPLHFANPQFDDYYNHEQPAEFNHYRSQFVGSALRRIKDFCEFYFGMLMAAPLLTLPWLLRDRRPRLLLVQLALSLIGIAAVVPYSQHYAAPLTATVLALIVQGLRHLRHWQHHGRPVGIGLSRMLVLFAIATFPMHMAKTMLEIRHGVSWTNPHIPERARIAAQLESLPGEHLVLVRYAADHNVNEEWVYNAADIDHAKVVWAREVPGENLTSLLDYFRNRRVWVVDADKLSAQPKRLQPTLSAVPLPADKNSGFSH